MYDIVYGALPVHIYDTCDISYGTFNIMYTLSLIYMILEYMTLYKYNDTRYYVYESR